MSPPNEEAGVSWFTEVTGAGVGYAAGTVVTAGAMVTVPRLALVAAAAGAAVNVAGRGGPSPPRVPAGTAAPGA